VPWADVLYAQDADWWQVHRAEVECTTTSELWTCANTLPGLNHIEVVDGEPGLAMKPGRIYAGGNTGYQLLGLAFIWGAARIVLLGYDMQLGPQGEIHHHGAHERLRNPSEANLRDWTQRFVQLGADLSEQGVEVINASRRTALTCFERMPIERALYESAAVAA
jgi:hypothetical protein